MKLYYFILLSFFIACQSETATTVDENPNPPAEDFNIEASDEEAIALADQVMEAMGGRKAWDETRYLTWNFFGSRKLFWDKQTGDVQIDVFRDSLQIYLNYKDDVKGAVYKNGIAFAEQDSIKKYVERGKSIWINDSYWLVMPFKLKDSGVTLKYKGQDTLETGQAAEKLQLTFEGVGNTPQNKYMVYVTKKDSLVKQWDFYTNATDTVKRFSSAWENYQPYGEILLSDNRGRGSLSEIAVYNELPEGFEWLNK
ncbi:MAG: hypothetical protein AAF806_32065 [Bacteroidota bacterium]